jgi:hypothetical protein
MSSETNALATAADALTADLRAGEPGPWPDEIYTAMLAMTRQAVSQLGHLTMTYYCDACGFEWKVWCTLGCEGPPELKEQGLALAVPFGMTCPAWPDMQPCKGTMSHVRWHEDLSYAPPQLIPEDAPRFVLPETGSGEQFPCGRLEIPMPAMVRARRFHSDERSDS